MENAKSKKPFYKKWWFWLIVVVVVVGIIGAVSGSKNSESSQSDSSSPSSSVSSTAPVSSSSSEKAESETSSAPQAVEVKAVDIITAYEENEVAADDQYKDQLLKITGVVKSVGTDVADRAYVMLADERNEYALLGVQCYFDEENKDSLADLKEGDTVTISGTCEGKVVSVSVKHCQLEA